MTETKQAKSVSMPATPIGQTYYSVGKKLEDTDHIITNITVSRDMAGSMGWMDAVKVWDNDILLCEGPFSSVESVQYV